jgi:hypothetical protein
MSAWMLGHCEDATGIELSSRLVEQARHHPCRTAAALLPGDKPSIPLAWRPLLQRSARLASEHSLKTTSHPPPFG